MGLHHLRPIGAALGPDSELYHHKNEKRYLNVPNDLNATERYRKFITWPLLPFSHWKRFMGCTGIRDFASENSKLVELGHF